MAHHALFGNMQGAPAGPRSLSLDGSNEYISIADAASLDITSELSIQCWFKSGDTNTQYMVAKAVSSGNQRSYYMQLDSSGGILGICFTSLNGSNYNAGVTTTTGFDDDAWHHAVMTYDAGDTLAIYVDGTLEAHTDLSFGSPDGTIAAGTAALEIGGGDGGGTLFTGNLTEVAIWDTAVLTSAEVTALYNSGVPIDVTSNSGNYTSSGDLVSYWPIFSTDSVTTSDGVKDSSGSNDGTGQNMEAGDLVTEYPS